MDSEHFSNAGDVYLYFDRAPEPLVPVDQEWMKFCSPVFIAPAFFQSMKIFRICS